MGKDIKGKTIAISGFGNVAWGAVTKTNHLGAKINLPYLDQMDIFMILTEFREIKSIIWSNSGLLTMTFVKPYAEKYESEFFEGRRPWEVKCDCSYALCHSE